jgi:hypothetical protein
MPYIEKSRREAVVKEGALTAGELNYAITKLCNDYIRAQTGVGYTHVNEVIGVLECAKQEFYRRVVAPYEDSKIMQNGDVY